MNYTAEQLRETAEHIVVNRVAIEPKDIAEVFRAHADLLESLSARLAEANADNFKLAAGQCCVDGGLLGDERGHQYCDLQRKLAEREADFQRMNGLIGSLRIERDGCSESARQQAKRADKAEAELEKVWGLLDEIYRKARRVANGHDQIAAVQALTAALDAYRASKEAER